MENLQHLQPNPKILSLMKKSYQIYKQQQSYSQITGLLFQEKIIYTSMVTYEKQSKLRQISKQEIEELKNKVNNFVEKINRLSMENFENNDQKQLKTKESFLAKSVQLLMVNELKPYFPNQNELLKLKILSFNNLSCIYKKKKSFSIALRSINYAIELQQKLLKTNSIQQKYSIIPTYLNKAAIYSQMKKHRESIEIINKAKQHIERIQKQIEKQIELCTNQQQKACLTQKRYYGLYMKMIIYYNLGAEKQHLNLKNQGLEFYKQSKQVAIIINNNMMVEKLQGIIQSIIGGRDGHIQMERNKL